MGEVHYRILIFEIVKKNYPVEIGFERLTVNGWETNGIFDDISMRDIMALFGTIKYIISHKKYDCLVFGVSEKEDKAI